MWLGASVPLCRCALRLECPPLLLKVKVAQSCPTLCDPMDCIVHRILQARILEWVAVPFSKESSQPRDRTQVSHIAGGFLGWGARSNMVQQRWKILCATTKTWLDLRKSKGIPKTLYFWHLSPSSPSRTPMFVLSSGFSQNFISILSTNLTMDLGKSFVFVYVCEFFFLIYISESLDSRWVRLGTPNAGGLGSIPGWGTRSCKHTTTKSPYAATQCGLNT